MAGELFFCARRVTPARMSGNRPALHALTYGTMMRNDPGTSTSCPADGSVERPVGKRLDHNQPSTQMCLGGWVRSATETRLRYRGRSTTTSPAPRRAWAGEVRSATETRLRYRGRSTTTSPAPRRAWAGEVRSATETRLRHRGRSTTTSPAPRRAWAGEVRSATETRLRHRGRSTTTSPAPRRAARSERNRNKGRVDAKLTLRTCGCRPWCSNMIITPTFTANFDTNFGVNATAAKAAWAAAAQVFTSHFSDNIHINITVDAVPAPSVFGESPCATPAHPVC